tara:strand:- start:9703 stop:10239 length:537 start_codon:yes stop_codon:yes gene_type:complete
MKSLCVYCGSKPSNHSQFRELARKLGIYLAENQIRLVYGGAKVGLMGEAADACLNAGGQVLGIIPQSLVQWEVAHDGLQDLRIVDSMHARKALMEKESHAFLAIPGGLGTLDELFEILTWRQMQLHQKPIALINESGFFDHLLAHLRNCSDYQLLNYEDLHQLETFSSLNEWIEGFHF